MGLMTAKLGQSYMKELEAGKLHESCSYKFLYDY